MLYNGLQVAEMAEHGELVGVVRGYNKEVGFGLTKSHSKMGYILGLRVSPTHRYLLYSALSALKNKRKNYL